MLCDIQIIGLSPTPAALSLLRSSLLLNAMDFLNKTKTASMTGGTILQILLPNFLRQERLLVQCYCLTLWNAGHANFILYLKLISTQ